MKTRLKIVCLLLSLLMLLSACSGPAYEPGFVEDENYYNQMAEFQLAKPSSLIYQEKLDCSIQENDPELYSRAVEMGSADSLSLEYILTNEDVSLYIYSEKNVNDYLVVPFSEFIKQSIEENTDMEVVSIEDIHQEAPFRCLIAKDDFMEKRYYITFAGDSFVYMVITGQTEAVENIIDDINPVGYWGEDT